jgi:hypothetical protein
LPAPAAIVAPVAIKLVPPAIPLMLPQVAEPVAIQVGAAVSVTPAGRLSVTVTLVAFAGPLLVAVIEYVRYETLMFEAENGKNDPQTTFAATNLPNGRSHLL